MVLVELLPDAYIEGERSGVGLLVSIPLVFMVVESRLPQNAAHIQGTLGIRVLSPLGMWDILRPWAAALFY